MNCRCGAKTTVVETRCMIGLTVRRRRCTECGRVFYTEEVAVKNFQGYNKMAEIEKDKYGKA